MNKKVLLFTVAAGLAASAWGATASDSIRTLDRRSTALNDSVNHLGERTSAIDSRLAKVEKFLKYAPKFSGYANLEYNWEDGNGGGKKVSTFNLRRARLSAKGSFLDKKLDYTIQLEFAGTPKVLDAFFRYTPRKEFGVQVGEFKLPFSIENPYSPQALELSSNATVISKLVHYSDESGVNANGRDLGAAVYGKFFHKDGFSVLNYYLGVFNGSGINKKDVNKEKDLVGRIDIYPIKNLLISISGYKGWTDGVDNDGKTRTGRKDRYGAGFRYQDDKWSLRAEYIRGETLNGKLLEATGVKKSYASDGFYAVAGVWFFNHKLQPVIRYDLYRKDAARTNETIQKNYAIGLNYWPVKHIRLQANYTYQDIRREHNKATNVSNNVVNGVATFVF